MITSLNRSADWTGVRAGVAGIRLAGAACARAMLHLGADVVAVEGGDSPDHHRWAADLRELGAEVRLGDGESLPPNLDLLVVSPGFPPAAPLIQAAQKAGVPVWGELELAWRLRGPDAAPWLAVTGTNGKTTATLMLESILRADGRKAIAAANIGVSLVDAVLRDDLDVIAVEVGAQQLPFWHTVSPLAAVCLNIAEDHIDHFGNFSNYLAAKGRIYERCQVAAVYNRADEQTLNLAASATVEPGCRRLSFGLDTPGPYETGVVEELLVDRAFVSDPQHEAAELGSLEDVQPFAPHNVSNALAAATLARAYGVSADSVKRGLQDFEPAGHRIAHVAEIDGVNYVNDSKATNTHAAATSLLAYQKSVWIAGGLAKGQDFDELIQQCADRIRAVVLFGQDRAVISQALARHAPELPVVEVSTTDTKAMAEVVTAAADLAQPGDAVLLAPGCASWDMYTDYGQRGDLFAQEVNRLLVPDREG